MAAITWAPSRVLPGRAAVRGIICLQAGESFPGTPCPAAVHSCQIVEKADFPWPFLEAGLAYRLHGEGVQTMPEILPVVRPQGL